MNEANVQRERLVTLFSALSDPIRLEMFELIVRRGEVGCAEFDERFPISKSTISYHTKILNAAGMISTRREGRFFFYSPLLLEVEERLPGLIDRFRSDPLGGATLSPAAGRSPMVASRATN